ncbi:sensor histidine kinase [Haloarchaeobius amylolyticus]|uniref:sensor histidine kinase n=1 Tax=Haloarchaeobius amylolyticus TaxID=1198296 RepID=UPI00226FEA3A|nr:HAMP domain-containing sensor histidine kinase [Haloarchaeobius amylolyticus]
MPGADRGEQRPWVDELATSLPVSPLSALGTLLGGVIMVRAVADANPVLRDVIQGALPFTACVAVVVVDRQLVREGVGARDRLTVFSYGLFGFLAAAMVTSLHLLILLTDGVGAVPDPLYLTLTAGTIGVGAGAVAGTGKVREHIAAREAERQRARLDEFASVVSHDLRNPLSVAQAELEETFRTGDPAHLKDVKRSLDRMDDRIQDSLDLARQGRVVGAREPVALDGAATAAWDGVQTGDATLRVDYGGTLDADRARLVELLENLFRNAVEHGREDVTVTVEQTPEGFSVADDGPGIPEDAREQVFERGHTGADGSGLGLAIVESIADAHGWSVHVEDGREGGARFVFET